MLGQLRSRRLLLRDVTLADAPFFFELDQDPRVMRFLGGVRADNSVERMRTLLGERLEWYGKTPGLGLGACFLQPDTPQPDTPQAATPQPVTPQPATPQPDGEFVGWFMLRPRRYRPYGAGGELLDAVEDAELGYRLAHRFWGQGYATEMSRLLVQHGLELLQLPQIVAFVDAEHHASVRVLEKAGLSRTGRARYEAEDVELYRIASLASTPAAR